MATLDLPAFRARMKLLRRIRHTFAIIIYVAALVVRVRGSSAMDSGPLPWVYAAMVLVTHTTCAFDILHEYLGLFVRIYREIRGTALPLNYLPISLKFFTCMQAAFILRIAFPPLGTKWEDIFWAELHIVGPVAFISAGLVMMMGLIAWVLILADTPESSLSELVEAWIMIYPWLPQSKVGLRRLLAVAVVASTMTIVVFSGIVFRVDHHSVSLTLNIFAAMAGYPTRSVAYLACLFIGALLGEILNKMAMLIRKPAEQEGAKNGVAANESAIEMV